MLPQSDQRRLPAGAGLRGGEVRNAVASPGSSTGGVVGLLAAAGAAGRRGVGAAATPIEGGVAAAACEAGGVGEGLISALLNCTQVVTKFRKLFSSLGRLRGVETPCAS